MSKKSSSGQFKSDRIFGNSSGLALTPQAGEDDTELVQSGSVSCRKAGLVLAFLHSGDLLLRHASLGRALSGRGCGGKRLRDRQDQCY